MVDVPVENSFPSVVGTRLLMETTALVRPGRERGLGRYVRACLDNARSLGCDTSELRVADRSGRTAEFLDLTERSVRAYFRKCDVFHVTHPHVWAVARSPTVVSILDLIPLDVGGYRQTGIKTKFFLGRAAQGRVVLTISEFSASRIADRFQIAPDRIVVAPLFPVQAFEEGRNSPPPEGFPERYVLAVVDMATPDPRKRPDWIEPLARGLKMAGLTLVVAGAGTDKGGAKLGKAIGVGRVSDSRLAQLARYSVCFLYFSAYEGQGLPPLEAMTAGAAVVSTSNTAITEVVGSAGVLIQERAVDWTQAMAEDSNADATRRELVDACVAVDRDESYRLRLRANSVTQASLFSERRFRDGLAYAYGMATC